VLPFLAAVEGYLRTDAEVPGLRMTMHRVMSRLGSQYLQQVSPYVGSGGVTGFEKAGRTFAVNEGIMGAAFETGRIWRTAHFDSLDALRAALQADMNDLGDTGPIADVAVSYLAIPLLSENGFPVLVFYADCKSLNYFTDDERVTAIARMCQGFCRVIDDLQRSPVDKLKNFPLQEAEPYRGAPTVYRGLQEIFEGALAPRFAFLQSFNFEAAA
jgi:hypothetical protein